MAKFSVKGQTVNVPVSADRAFLSPPPSAAVVTWKQPQANELSVVASPYIFTYGSRNLNFTYFSCVTKHYSKIIWNNKAKAVFSTAKCKITLSVQAI